MSTLKNKSKSELIEIIESLEMQIQEFKSNKDLLLGSEEKLRAIFNSAADAIVETDISGKIIKVNKAVLRIYGSNSEKDFIGKSALGFYAQNEREKAFNAYKQTYYESIVEESEFTALKIDGTPFPVQITSSVLRDADGKPTGFVGIIKDITERKLAQKALQESENRLALVIEVTDLGLWDQDFSSGKIIRSDRWASMLGYNMDEINNDVLAWKNLIHPDDLPTIEQATSKYEKGKSDVFNVEHRMLTKDGKWRWIHNWGRIVDRTPDGKPLRALGVHLDITDRKRAAEKLEGSYSLLRATLESTADGILVVDHEGNWSSFNKKFLDMWGVPQSLIKSKDDKKALAFAISQLKGPDRFLKIVEELYENPYQKSFDTFEFKDGRIFERYSQPQKIGEEIYGRVWSFRDVSERKQAEEALKESEGKFRRLAENSPDIIYRHRLKPIHGFEYISPAVTKVSGYTPEDHYNDPGLGIKIIHPDDKPDLEKFATGKFSNLPHISRWIHKDGTTIWIEDKHSPVYDAENNLIAIEGVARNITERKNAEEALRQSENKYRTLFETMVQGVVYQDKNGKIISANPAAEKMLGLTVAQMQGRSSMDPRWKAIREDGSDFPGDTHPSMVALKTGEQVSNVMMGVFNPGLEEYRWLNVHAIPEFKMGEKPPLRVYTTFEDLTDRKRADDELTESEKRYRALFDQSPIIIWEEDFSDIKDYIDKLKADGIKDFRSYFNSYPDEIRHIGEMMRVTDINQKSVEFYGAESKQDLITELSTYFTEESWSVFREEIIALSEGHTVFESEIPIRKKNNEQKQLLFKLSILPEDQHTWKRVIVSFVDITERKLAEDALKEQSYRNEQILETTLDGYILVNTEGKIIDVNPAYCDMIGYSWEELLKMNIRDVEVKTPPEEVDGRIQQMVRIGGDRFETKHKHKDGHILELDTSTSIMYLDDNPSVAAFVRDITESKRAEEALRESEKRFRRLAENSPDIIYRYRLIPTPGFEYISPVVTKISGYTPEEHYNDPGLGFKIIHPEDKPALDKLATGEFSNLPHSARWIHKDGSTIWIEDKHSSVTDAEGNIIAIEGVARDITERKNAEEAMRESENKFREMADLLPQIVYETDLNANLTFVNKRALSIFGYSKEDFENGFNVLDVLIPEDRKRAQENMQNIMNGKSVKNTEYTLVKKDGSTFPVLIYSNPVLKDGKPLGLRGIIVDISERKQAEEALRESERWLSTLMSNLPGMAYRCKNDTNWTMEFISDGGYSLTGYRSEELVGTIVSYAELIHPEDRQMVWDNVQEALEKKQPFQLTYRITTSSGEEKWVWERGQAIYGTENDVISLEGFITDITEGKKAEKKLRDSHNQLRSLAERLQMIREEERATVAREIHDDLGQSLTALKMDISWMKKNPGMTEKLRAEKINTMLGLTDSTIQTVKRIATELRPGILDDLGLIPAIEWETEEFRKRSGIKCNLKISVEEISLEDSTSIAVFRIFQESLTNIVRHSGATKVELTVKSKGDLIQMEITDNGVGITEEQMSSPKSLGLMGMNERVSFFGGKLAISKSEEGGTTVKVYIPIIKG